MYENCKSWPFAEAAALIGAHGPFSPDAVVRFDSVIKIARVTFTLARRQVRFAFARRRIAFALNA